MRRISVVTGSRADYAICRPVLRRLAASASLRLHLIVAGMHLSPRYGHTIDEIVADGFEVGETVQIQLDSDTPQGIAESMASALTGFAGAYARVRPDLLVVLADRYEMHSAALAALQFRIPVAHIEGGDLTLGAIDDALRHGITKLSHLHFVSTEDSRRRVIQLGEEPWRVTVSGAPSLDNIAERTRITRHVLQARHRVSLDPAPILVTLHPVTLEFEQTGWIAEELLTALDRLGHPVIFTSPNADAGGGLIRSAIERFVREHSNAWLVTTFGTDDYLALLENVSVMVGNSSSGLIEAPSFCLPVVNIGTRQAGRVRARNVVDVGYAADEIAHGIATATAPAFRAALQSMSNPYGDGTAAARIVDRLGEVELDDPRLTNKQFFDIH